jgi:hypothetical protein
MGTEVSGFGRDRSLPGVVSGDGCEIGTWIMGMGEIGVGVCM